MTQATTQSRQAGFGPAPVRIQTTKVFGTARGVTRKAYKLGIYGPEGCGKSTLVSLCHGVVFIDAENSTQDLDVNRVQGVTDWPTLRQFVQQATPDNFPIFAIDTMTRVEDWCTEYVLRNKKSNEGLAATDSIEDYKYKAGITFVCDEFRRFLGDLDQAFLRGCKIIMIAHNRFSRGKNPDGSDYWRAEPRLVHDESKGSNMLAWVAFLDHLVYVEYDLVVGKGGKGTASGSRTLRTFGTPMRMAKTRSIPVSEIVYAKDDGTLWKYLNGEIVAPAQPSNDVPL